MVVFRWVRGALALAVCSGVALGCGGDPCEDYCAEVQGCANAEFAQGDQCVSQCNDAVAVIEDKYGCGSEYEDILDCAADADDTCQPNECVSEALDYLDCTGTLND